MTSISRASSIFVAIIIITATLFGYFAVTSSEGGSATRSRASESTSATHSTTIISPIPKGNYAASLVGEVHDNNKTTRSTASLVGSAASSSSSTILSSCYGLDDSVVHRISKLRIALIKPIFTATAYSNAFYLFYDAHKQDPSDMRNVTSDLNLLNATVVDRWGTSWTLNAFLSWSQAQQCGLVMGSNLYVLNDIDVNGGALFYTNGSRRFDAAILGFTEYVTQQEYSSYKQFVATGGTLVMMDSAHFIARVEYYPASNHIALVRGHGWAFNGRSAWRFQQYGNWRKDNANWVGSNNCCFEATASYERTLQVYAVANTTNPISIALREKFGDAVFGLYHPHEESDMTNSTDSAVAFLTHMTKGYRVAAYTHRYKLGLVAHIGIFSDDIIGLDPSVQYFLIQSLAYPPQAASGSSRAR